MDRLGGIAVITGGASGIGAACCRVFRDWGAEVVVLDRDIARARMVAEQIGGHAGCGDVGDADGIDRVAADIEAAHGAVAMLVTSAEKMLPMPIPTPASAITAMPAPSFVAAATSM